MIDAHKIVYNNLSSEEFDVTLHVSFNEDNGTTSSFLGREGIYTEHYNGHHTIHGAKYNEVLTPRFTLIKNNYGDFDAVENRRMLSWLTASEKPGWLEVYKDDSNVVEWRIFGCITSVEQYKLGNGRVVGYEFEMESSAPYAWSPALVYPEVYANEEELSNNDETNDYLTVSGTETFTITCDTDEYNQLLYPKVTITFKGQNEYFPLKFNPLTESSYSMVPNVIYKWEEEYIKATVWSANTKYYSDKNGTLASPQPDNTAQITSGNYYVKNPITYYGVNLNGIEDKGKYTIGIRTTDVITQNSPPTDYVYYYFPADHFIKKLAVENGIYVWKPVALMGMAVKIDNTYMWNDKPVTKEAIIAGGAMDEVIVLDGTNKLISGTKGSTTRIIGDDFNWEWIPFAYGENDITVNGNCTIKFEWLEPRKVGSL